MKISSFNANLKRHIIFVFIFIYSYTNIFEHAQIYIAVAIELKFTVILKFFACF